MRPPGTAQQLERRRRQAIRLLKAGKNLSAVARAVSASVSSVFRWNQTSRRKGLQGLRPRATPGRPPQLSPSQKKRLVTLLLKGPLAAGYRTDLWTFKRVAEMMRRRVGGADHPCHAWTLLVRLGWSCQQPARRALPRDEAALAQGTRYRWPPIKKRSPAWRPSGLPR